MLSNEIKEGAGVVANGFKGRMADNGKGNTRLVDVFGICGWEMGSVYVWDISSAENLETGEWERVQLTEKQIKSRGMVKAMGF
jgi:hypothetical protein